MKFPISSIRPNPFRHIERYPYREDKIAALRQSVHDTGFWDNVVARVTDDGAAEIAYGHHRLELLRRDFSSDFEVDLILRDLDDTHMIKIMAAENMEEWGTSAAVEQETVRAVVEAYAEGKITLPEPPDNVKLLRYAPYFQMGGHRGEPLGAPYTAKTVAEFLGWDIDKVKVTLGALELIERGRVADTQFVGLGTEQAKALVIEVRQETFAEEENARKQAEAAERAKKEAEQAAKAKAKAEEERELRERQATRARDEQVRRQREAEAAEARRKAEDAEERRIRAEYDRRQREAAQRRHQEEADKRARERANQMTNAFHDDKGVAQARNEASQARINRRTGSSAPPEISERAHQVAVGINRLFTDRDERVKLLNSLFRYREHLTPKAHRDLVLELDALIKRVTQERDRWIQGSLQTSADDIVDAEVVDDVVVDSTQKELVQ